MKKALKMKMVINLELISVKIVIKMKIVLNLEQIKKNRLFYNNSLMRGKVIIITRIGTMQPLQGYPRSRMFSSTSLLTCVLQEQCGARGQPRGATELGQNHGRGQGSTNQPRTTATHPWETSSILIPTPVVWRREGRRMRWESSWPPGWPDWKRRMSTWGRWGNYGWSEHYGGWVRELWVQEELRGEELWCHVWWGEGDCNLSWLKLQSRLYQDRDQRALSSNYKLMLYSNYCSV